MNALIIDGKKIAAQVRAEVSKEVDKFQLNHHRVPGLDVIIVGENPASQVYVLNKERAANEVGMRSTVHRLPSTVTQVELLNKVKSVQSDPLVDGVLVQLPLPAHINAEVITDAINPDYDVDGFHPVNAGLLSCGRPKLVPCTPLGCMHLIDSLGCNLSGMHAVVIGRSNIVGKPLSQLLLARNVTVTIAHSRTRHLNEVCREADILVAAVGVPKLVKGDWVKEGAIVIDVGINREDNRLVGDVDFERAAENAYAITPVPGGVGPMTIAFLLKNTLKAAKMRPDW
jgi:methylenetetrahydrofolate dehydrogenase (NADP+)/methenyltetrahydrofolate cyclohydrolase